MATKRYISNVIIDNADDLSRLLRGKRRKIIMRSSSGSYWTPLKPLGGEVANYYATGNRSGLVIPEAK